MNINLTGGLSFSFKANQGSLVVPQTEVAGLSAILGFKTLRQPENFWSTVGDSESLLSNTRSPLKSLKAENFALLQR